MVDSGMCLEDIAWLRLVNEYQTTLDRVRTTTYPYLCSLYDLVDMLIATGSKYGGENTTTSRNTSES